MLRGGTQSRCPDNACSSVRGLNVCFGPSPPAPSLKCLHEIGTGAPSPSRANYGEDKYSSNASENSAHDTGARTQKEANRSTDKAT